MSSQDVALNAHKAHFGPISKGLIDFVENNALLRSRYLFTKTLMRVQYAYCTHCNQNHKPDQPLKHNADAVCPHCQSECKVKKSHVGRKYLRDVAYVVYYEKSVMDPSTIVALGFYVKRDYSGSYENVQTLYCKSCSYVFQMGNSSMYYTGYYDESKWYRRENISSEFPLYKNGAPCYVSTDSIRSAVMGTPMQYSTWEYYSDGEDMTKFFGLYTKYPCIEYLTKMGYKYFVHAKLYGLRTYDAIKWSGKTLSQVLKLNKKDLMQFREYLPSIQFGDEAEALALKLYQMTLNDRNRPSLKELGKMADEIYRWFPKMKPMLKYQNLRFCVSYVKRQYNKLKGKKRNYYYSYDGASILSLWKDYIEECEQLGMDLTRQEIVFPHNLLTAHEATSQQVKIVLSELEAKKIAKRSEELECFRFSYDGYMIRPPVSGDEIIAEGKFLRHCVGGYAQRHADGETNILMLRKIADPDTPFITLEIKAGKIRQAYGYQHRAPSGDLVQLLDKFKAEKLREKSKAKKREASAV